MNRKKHSRSRKVDGFPGSPHAAPSDPSLVELSPMAMNPGTSSSALMASGSKQLIHLTVGDLTSEPTQSQPLTSKALTTKQGPAHQLPRLDQRLDQYCTQILGDEYSRSQLQRAIREGKILVDGKVETRPGARLKLGQQLSIPMFDLSDLAGADRDHLTPWDYPLEIHYEDEELLVINKPHGIAVHPGAGQPNQTILNALVGYLQKHRSKAPDFMEPATISSAPSSAASTTQLIPPESSPAAALASSLASSPPSTPAQTNNRPGIVHRLDRDTTGLMVLAKTPFAERALQEQFAARSVGRRYLALALSSPRRMRGIDQADLGTIDQPLGRHPSERKIFTVMEDGRRAVTHWRIVERMEFAALVELRLETGRTHQIRVHLDFISSPVIGDKTYGDFSSLPKTLLDKSLRFGRQALHAQTLEFDHPRTGERLSFSVAPPKDMLQLIDDFRGGRLLLR